MRRLNILALTLILLTVSSGTSSAQTRSTNEPCEVCLRKRDFERCEADAKRVDAQGKRIAGCQRELDAAHGREQILVAQGAQKDEAIADLLRRPTWGQALTLFAVGLSAGLCTSAARGDERARVPCGVSAAATMALGFVLWRW